MNLLKKIKNHPKNKVALIDEQLQEITYYRLIQDAMFMKKFIKKNSVIFLIGSNTVEWITFYISALDEGAILFLIDSEIEFIYLKKLIKIYKPSFIFKPKDKKNFHFDEVSSFKNYHLLKNKSVNIINNDNLRLLISTSGTTGNPKFVKLSELNLDDNIEKIVEYLKIKKEHKLITTLPPHYSYGLSLINSHLYQGSSIILSNLSLINRGFWNLLKLSKASTFGAVPYHLEIMDKIKIKNLNFCNIKYITHAGGSIEVNLLKKILKFLSKKKIKLISMYGQAEASPRMSYLQPRFNLKKIGSIGKPISKGKFRILNNNGKEITQPYKKGELIYEGKNVCLGYSQNLKSLNSYNENKGILNTGDIAYKDEDGFYYISGRKNRYVKIFGNRVSLSDIEKRLSSKGIKNICVNKKEKIYVYVISKNLKKSIDNRVIAKKIKIHFSKIFVKFIKRIPITSNGKIAYSKL